MYTLTLPFRLPVGQAVGQDEATTKLGNLTYSLTTNGPYCVLTAHGFFSEREARDHIYRIWAGLMWLLLNRELSPNAVLEAQSVTYTTDPIKAARNLSANFGLSIDGPVDGLIDGSRPAVFPTDKRFRTITGGDATLTVTTARSTILASLSEGVAFPRSDELIDDDKLRVALELYGAYFTESSSNARFLTLVMALEALAIGAPRPQRVLDLIDQWKTQVDSVLSDGGWAREELESLDALRRELFFRKEDSIRKQIYNLVVFTLQQADDPEAEELAQRAKKLYDLRSELVHNGKLPDVKLSFGVTEAKLITQRVLRARYLAGVC